MMICSRTPYLDPSCRNLTCCSDVSKFLILTNSEICLFLILFSMASNCPSCSVTSASTGFSFSNKNFNFSFSFCKSHWRDINSVCAF